MSLAESVGLYGGISGDLPSAAPPWLTIARRLAELNWFSVTPSEKACGGTLRLSWFDTLSALDSELWQREQYFSFNSRPRIC